MLIVKNDHMLPEEVYITIRLNKRGLMIRSKEDIFETLAVLGKSKKALLGLDENLKFQRTISNEQKIEIRYGSSTVDIRSTSDCEETRDIIDQAIELFKKVI